MTSKIPNPSFIIINSHEQEKLDLIEHLDKVFSSSKVLPFDCLSDYAVSEEFTDENTVFMLFDNCLDLSIVAQRNNISNITSENAAIVFCTSADYFFTQQLIELGVSEILTNTFYSTQQLQQSIYNVLSRKNNPRNDVSSAYKNKFFDVLSNYYGSLVSALTSQLDFKQTSKGLIEKLELNNECLSKKNLRDYVHKDDHWQLENLAALLDQEEIITLHPIRFLSASGSFEVFQANFFKDCDVEGQFIVDIKVQPSQEIKDAFRLENNERFSAIAQATNSTIYEYFPESKLLFTSNKDGIYGFIEGEYLEEYFAQYLEKIHIDDKQRLLKKFKTSLTTTHQKPFVDEYRILKSNNRYQTILERYRIFVKNGKPYKRIGALTDITEVTAQNALIALEKQVYEMNAAQTIDFCEVIAYLECKMEELIPNTKCMVLTISDHGHIESISQRDHNNYFVHEIAEHSKTTNPLCDKVGHRGKISESERWAETIEVTNIFNVKYFWTSPAVNKENETIANVVLLFTEFIETDEIEEVLVERITNLVGVLVAKNRAITETRTSRERYEMVAKATNDTIWDWNVVTDVVSWNKGIFETYGYKKEDIEETSTWWFSNVHPEDSIRVSVKLYNFLEQKTEKWHDEYRLKCADGTYKYVLDRGFLEKNSEGKAVRMIGSMQDITHSKIEEERLKLLSAAITQANDAVIITETPRSIYALPKIVYVNPAFSKMTGYQFDEVVGQSPQMFLGKNAMVEQQTILLRAEEFNKEFVFEALNRRKNGEEYWARFSMIPVSNNQGEHSHWISLQSDITNQKEQEKEKEHLIQELTRHNNDLKQFSYITSHNLRAPLSNLIGLLNLIDDIVIEDEDLKEIIDGFSKSTHLLNQTINDLINIVIIKDNLSIKREQIIIKDTLQNILDQLSYTISLYAPRITIDTTKAPFLTANRTYIESIFLNLITNALRYSDSSRQLEINISSQDMGDEIILRFEDNGVGIDLERNRDKLFGLYQRFHDYPDSKGLGLYLVKSQVTSMGGGIAVESELGKGSCFIVAFKK